MELKQEHLLQLAMAKVHQNTKSKVERIAHENNKRFKFQRIIHSVIPAFLLALSVGQIYAFTNFASEIATSIGASQSAVQFSFSLGIFFLGMGAAFFGSIVEKNIVKASFIGTVLFLAGLYLTAIGIDEKCLWAIYLGYGLLLGIGTGIIYISPVKTMMLWFKKNKALAAALPIISFGLGSTLSTIIYKGFSCGAYHFEGLYDSLNVASDVTKIADVFEHFAWFYAPFMLVGCCLLRKPDNACICQKDTEHEAKEQKHQIETHPFSYLSLIKDKFFIGSWVFMFLNISAGLCLIPLAKQMMTSTSAMNEMFSATLVTATIALCGVFNGGGRFVFAFWSDRLRIRANILMIVSGISILAMIATSFSLWCIPIALLVINACYGAGFSVIPAILADYYGMDNLSKIHGAVLSAWGVAGLVGNQMAMYMYNTFGTHTAVIILLICMYATNIIVSDLQCLRYRIVRALR